jgi:hypothetical protein
MLAFFRALGLAALVVGAAGAAAAQNLTIPAPLTKNIVVYNNSARTIYPVLSIGIKLGNPDLWLQAQFVREFPKKNPYPPFPTTLVYRAYVNSTKGIPPGGSVEITVPFYSQLKEVTGANIGEVNDQFIDWWNAARVFLFDGATALDAAKITDGANLNGGDHRPTPIKFLAGAAKPTCSAGKTVCEPIEFLSYRIDAPSGVPFELQEYTFASAEGPPTHPRPAKIMPEWVNYNISSLDSVYLPVAVGPLTRRDVPYVGSTATVATFNANLKTFAENGANWPYYLPVYFASAKDFPPPTYPTVYGAGCSMKPFPSTKAYLRPKLPGTFNLLVGSYLNPPPTPPVLSSNPPKFPLTTCVPSPPPPFKTPKLGTEGQRVLDLWHKCTESTKVTSATCKDIRVVDDFFRLNYQNECGAAAPEPPNDIPVIQAVYGWVPIRYGSPPCQGKALVTTPGYAKAIATYCTLQYNYLDPTVPTADIFNPYTRLIHQMLQSSSYAFSIDDELSFKHIVDDGIILTIGGAGGLVNKTPTPLPTLRTYKKQCRAAS